VGPNFSSVRVLGTLQERRTLSSPHSAPSPSMLETCPRSFKSYDDGLGGATQSAAATARADAMEVAAAVQSDVLTGLWRTRLHARRRVDSLSRAATATPVWAATLARACAVRWLKNLLPMPWRGRARSPAVPANGGSVVTGVELPRSSRAEQEQETTQQRQQQSSGDWRRRLLDAPLWLLQRGTSAPETAVPPPPPPPPQPRVEEEPMVGGDTSCCVCMDAPREACLFPCGHVALCYDCACQLAAAAKHAKVADGPGNVCPLCRRRIQHVARVYLA